MVIREYDITIKDECGTLRFSNSVTVTGVKRSRQRAIEKAKQRVPKLFGILDSNHSITAILRTERVIK